MDTGLKISQWMTFKICRLRFKLIRKSILIEKNTGDAKEKQQQYAYLFTIDQVNGQIKRLLERLELQQPASFHQCIVNRTTTQKHSVRELPENVLDSKIIAPRFVSALGYDVPEVIQYGVKAEELRFSPGIVIKPVDSCTSKGVYIYHNPEFIYEVKTNKRFNTEDSLKTKLNDYINLNNEDSWITEKYIYGEDGRAPVDLKFYSFYGEVPLIVEVMREPDTKYCYWNANREQIDVGKKKEHSFTGDGFEESHLEIIKKISLEIPAPFTRIDFLKGRDGFFFGEFTSYPGGNHRFMQKYDTQLGHEYLKAEARLQQDLIDGKPFETYKKFC